MKEVQILPSGTNYIIARKNVRSLKNYVARATGISHEHIFHPRPPNFKNPRFLIYSSTGMKEVQILPSGTNYIIARKNVRSLKNYVARATGFEPAISSVTGRRLNRAGPRPHNLNDHFK